ncbi:glycosyltransferase family 2 protein [Fibrobacter intestinalis]|uniref:Glycosyltransferase involved in cell wall bisynthesis n=1 Tax=Fibrobacter intestinalis TaxID=28122 RepID=A0A1T4K2B3_9BACT|nr:MULTISPECIES: glycosyltransferase family 2 protein [Fibrobacter]PBC74231.1 glycosyltransferase involved in cell wall bisynthesis [Fibrobacter sp. NR9]SJZ36596.1 Glycosyltransferase involved in cell wall bisynthesis [Fibrobacter intestinalis]
MPFVSVIVPNYNHAPYLKQRLDSVFNQTFQDFEVIILDDCSTDNSKEIIEEYRNRPQTSHIIYNAINSGSPFKQWAKGFELAQGEYIWIAESDDWAELNFLEEMIRILDKHESLTLAFCESFWEFSEKTVFGQTSLRDSFFNGLEFIQKRQIYGNCIVNASSVLFRKKFLSNIPTDYQDFQGSGDYILWSYLCELGNIFYTTKRLNHFRRHESATTSKCIATGRSFFENHRIYNYFKSKGYVSNFAHYRIVNYELKQIELNKDVLIKNNVYSQCKSLWENEKRIGNLISSLLIFFAKQINEYSNLPFHAKIWKFFHLPDTNIRGKLFRRR